MEINVKEVYVIDGSSYMCIAKNEEYIIMAAYYTEDEDLSPELHLDDVIVYDAVNPDYGPLEKIEDYSEKGNLNLEITRTN